MHNILKYRVRPGTNWYHIVEFEKYPKYLKHPAEDSSRKGCEALFLNNPKISIFITAFEYELKPDP